MIVLLLLSWTATTTSTVEAWPWGLIVSSTTSFNIRWLRIMSCIVSRNSAATTVIKLRWMPSGTAAIIGILITKILLSWVLRLLLRDLSYTWTLHRGCLAMMRCLLLLLSVWVVRSCLITWLMVRVWSVMNSSSFLFFK